MQGSSVRVRPGADTGWRAAGAALLAAAFLLSVAVAATAWAGGRDGLPIVWCRLGAGDLVPPRLTGARLLTAWQLDPVALLGVAGAGGLYALGARQVRRRHPTHPWSAARGTSFGLGLLVVVLSTCSSIAVYDMTLFSMHMVQHLALIMVAPPLLAAGRPLTLALHATRNPWHTRIKRAARGRVVTAVTWPPVAYGGYAVTIVATHLTGFMDQVMTHPWLGQAEHLLYLVVGYLFFVLVFGEEPIRWRLSLPGRLMLVVLSMAVDTFVGIVLMQGTQPIVMLPHPGWGSNALVDTQTGGAIMWVFGDGIMAVLVVLLFRSWAVRPEHARRQNSSWLERSRSRTLAEHTGYGADPGERSGSVAVASVPKVRIDLDDDEAALAAYNAWLARLAGGSSGPGERTGR